MSVLAPDLTPADVQWAHNAQLDEWHAVHPSLVGITACFYRLEPRWRRVGALPPAVRRENVDQARLCWACARVTKHEGYAG